MGETPDAAALAILRSFQIGVTLYAIWRLWYYRTCDDTLASPLILLLFVHLFLSASWFLHDGRFADDANMLWWAWVMFDTVLPFVFVLLAQKAPQPPDSVHAPIKPVTDRPHHHTP